MLPELLFVAVFLAVSLLLTKVWVHIMHGVLAKHIHIDGARRVHVKPSILVVASTILCTGLLCFLAFKTLGGVAPFDGPQAMGRLMGLLVAIGVVAVIAEILWREARGYVFAFTVATVVTFVLLGFKKVIFDMDTANNPFLMALSIVSVVIAWRFLFGPWKPHVKAMVLGTFLFWIAVHLVAQESSSERMAHLLTIAVAIIPALIWCMLFLDFHVQRRSLVLLMFFSGMIATAPILFYDALVRHGIELHFFLFRIIPENFNRVSSAFVAGNVSGMTGLQSTLLSTLIAFMIVGLIEEVSKFWVLRSSGERFFSSIDDVMQLSIIVAIGFAFAENVLNPTYFLSFVKAYLIEPSSPQWMGFLGSMLGRSILTSMVHILAGGVLGYFYGLAIFARPYLQEAHAHGKRFALISFLHATLQLPEQWLFRTIHMTTGLILAIGLHGLFNFLVTLQDMLPGRPETLGDLFGAASPAFLHSISFLLVPSLFYVVGGFWVLTILFLRQESQKERGHLVISDTFITGGI